MPDHPDPVGGDFEAGRRVGSLHPQGALLDHGYDLRTAVSSLVRKALSHSSPGRQPPHEKPRLDRGRAGLPPATVRERIWRFRGGIHKELVRVRGLEDEAHAHASAHG
jgi:hypothetical protein